MIDLITNKKTFLEINFFLIATQVNKNISISWV